MKKVLLALLVLVVVIAGGIYYVISNLDSLVENIIETAGTDAIGSQVEVGSVELELMQGRASIYDFTIANPEGFSNVDMISFSEFSVVLDINNLSAEEIGIVSVVARDPKVLVEAIGTDTNIAVVSNRLGSGEPAATTEASDDPGPVISIGSIMIENIQGELVSDQLSAPQALNLGSINLQGLSGTSSELAAQILQQILGQLRGVISEAIMNATEAEIRELIDENVDQARQQLEAEVGELQDDIEQQARDEVEERLQDRLGNLLNN